MTSPVHLLGEAATTATAVAGWFIDQRSGPLQAGRSSTNEQVSANDSP
jgi:hypothetical protein